MFPKVADSFEDNKILRQLKEMFPSTPHWRLREVCNANNWHFRTCVEHLVDFNANDLQEKQNSNVSEKRSFNRDEERIGNVIRKGYRVMIIMRGPPGAGKSFLARSILNKFLDLENEDYKVEDFICSSDDYFYNDNGEYKYNSVFISDAHAFNHRRVEEKAKAGFSPIIVDNTNMQLWEMLPYAKFAVENNYLIEILEPKNPWCNSPSALAQKNRHGVTKNRIQHIMEKYEKGSVSSLTKMLKNAKYTMSLPQLREIPPIGASAAIRSQNVQSPVKTISKNNYFAKDPSVLFNDISTTDAKEQRIKFKSKSSPASEVYTSSPSSTRDVYTLLERNTSDSWKPFESESVDFWGNKPRNKQDQIFVDSNNTKGEKSLLDLLREDERNSKNDVQEHMKEDKGGKKKTTSFERHSINCLNENDLFVTLRQIYPNKRISGLWDLFVKCNGDVDWAVDILLKEDELERLRNNSDYSYQFEDEEVFECQCNNLSEENSNEEDYIYNPNSLEQNATSLLHSVNAKPQRQRSRFSRSNQTSNPVLLEVKENIESRFVFGDDLYSEHLLKIRNNRSGIKDESAANNPELEKIENPENQSIKNDALDNVENDTGANDVEEDNESDEFGEEMLEISLGEQLVQQLVETFRNESSLEEQISPSLTENFKVFMPRSLAKQLYMLWVESAVNHIEEQRLKLIKEDEDFARLLKNPKYSEYKQSPNNLQEILDLEYAWKIYYLEKERQKASDMENLHTPTDLATHLTQMKLCETFPDIPRETLLDILATNGNDFNKTVAVLESTKQTDKDHTTPNPMEFDRREQVLVNQDAQKQQRQERQNNCDVFEPQYTLDEAKRLALREFEESRNLAAHHCQLKAECFHKAKEAMKKGNGGTAYYYSQIASLHVKKIDMYNHRAANCIVEVHKNTQNNADLLDLHYLYIIEALGCLDLFLDRQITGLRVASRNYKHVFIITGRGKHSAGGVSMIKNRVKARLKERYLRWSEVNPGLLKVKIFSSSRHSKNI